MVKIVNLLYNTSPSIVHAPGKREFNPLWGQIIASYNDSIYHNNVYDDLDIITWSSKTIKYDENQSHKIPMIFVDSVHRSGLSVNVLISNTWETNRIKIFKTIEYLESSSLKFVLACDCHDAIMLNSPIDYDVLDRYDCEMLFNAEINFWPPEMIKMRHNQDRLSSGIFRYLNGGAWFGYRQTCLEFFKRASDIAYGEKNRPYSEQVCLHNPYVDMYPVVKIDHRCELFQVINRVSLNDIEILKKTD